MGWTTDLFCNISFNKETYDTKDKVESDLEECKSLIKECKQELRDFALMTEPQKLLNIEEYESAYSQISRTVEDNLLSLEENIVKEYKLELLLKNWDKCHQGNLAIPRPQNITYNDAFLECDFIETINNVKDE